MRKESSLAEPKDFYCQADGRIMPTAKCTDRRLALDPLCRDCAQDWNQLPVGATAPVRFLTDRDFPDHEFRAPLQPESAATISPPLPGEGQGGGTDSRPEFLTGPAKRGPLDHVPETERYVLVTALSLVEAIDKDEPNNQVEYLFHEFLGAVDELGALVKRESAQ